MKTIHLEIVRQGPPHNQLLSPLTEYLALCENHPAVPVRLPFEHAVLERRLKALRYREHEEYRPLDIEEVKRWMTYILSQVPGLVRELAHQTGAADPSVHLRLTLSANELALLPFELASGSYVFGSAGEELVLQSQAPVCITREGRRQPTERLEWPPPPYPKILFAAAAPSSEIPLREHLLALRRIINPWLGHACVLAEHIKVLPQATLQQIEDECATGAYTHVHILSHGIPARKGDDRRFELALHDRLDLSKPDFVDGPRLAKAIRPPRRGGTRGFARPVIVTLAACDAGGVGDIVSPGASIAHALHEEGVPLVVASQFPLSFAGSVIMTKVLYEGLLNGDDPRTLLVNLRRELFTQAPATHDWASIVAYASFPPDFDDVLANAQVSQTHRRFEAAFNHIDRDMDKPLDRVEEARRRFDLLLKREGTGTRQNASIYGMVASAEKRIAELEWKRLKETNPAITPQLAIKVRDRLTSSRSFYEKTFKEDRSKLWALVQVLALTAVLGFWDEKYERGPARWELARRFSEEELYLGNPERLSWANANLMELYVLAPLIPEVRVSPETAASEAERYAYAFRSVTEAKSMDLHSTRRQMERYSRFFVQVNPKMKPAADIADHILEILPDLGY